MDFMNSGLIVKLAIGTALFVGFVYIIYKSTIRINKKFNKLSTKGKSKVEIEQIILNYLHSYKVDNKEYELAHFYSRQLHIIELQNNYETKIGRIIFSDFNFTIEEKEFADIILQNLTEKIICVNFSKTKSKSNFWIFLLNFYKLQGRVEALNEINTTYGIAETDIQRFNEYEKDNLNRIEQLKIDFIKMNT